jgi:hypothetical protein
VDNQSEYIDRLQMEISRLHGCDSKWVKTVPVHEAFPGQAVWNGDVEVFSVEHPNALFAYAWSTSEGKFTAVLGIFPANTPREAVRASIVNSLGVNRT